MSTDIERERQDRERAFMAGIPLEKSWQVPAQADKGPVTIALRVPEVTVTDSAGRHIVITPEQADLIGSKLGNVSDWLHHGDTDWIDPDA